MPKKQKTPTANLPTIEQIYDAMMAKIEPDLLTTSLASAQRRKRGETQAQYLARMDGYRKAFTLYEKCFNAYLVMLQNESQHQRVTTRLSAEKQAKAQEEQLEDQLLTQIANL